MKGFADFGLAAQEAAERMAEMGEVFKRINEEAEAELESRGIAREFVAPGISSELRPALEQLASLDNVVK